MKTVEIKKYVEAINELHTEFVKSTNLIEKHRFAVALSIMADQLMLALSPIINAKIIKPGIIVEDYLPNDRPPTPQKTAKIYQFKEKE